MLFDIGKKQRYEKEHIPRSLYAVCNEKTKKNIMTKLPNDIEIVLELRTMSILNKWQN